MEPICKICGCGLSEYGCTEAEDRVVDRLGADKIAHMPPRCYAPVEVQDGAR
jgi:hypothetical protein